MSSPWVHRLAVVLVVLTWPLIWIGGLVTTYDAGMAVPDWPGTYGYNMFLYPWKTWLLGPFDLLIEHGHRLLASLVGLVTIGLVAVAWFREPRRWVVGLCGVALVAVIFQGVLGGVRVRLDARTVAMVHGIFGPTFFALCVLLAGVTGRAWQQLAAVSDEARYLARRGRRLAAFLVVLAFFQLVLGAQLRHLLPMASPMGVRHIVWTHLALAMGILLATFWHVAGLRKCGILTLSGPGRVLLGLIALQIALGAGTWIANYAWPWWFADWAPAARHLIQAKGMGESWVTTGHVAIGSLILAVAAWNWLRLVRAGRASAAV